MIQKASVVEFKAVKALEKVHYRIVRSYLRATGIRDGLLLNFGAARQEFRRVGGDLPG
ncbi:GxxExxY protein [Myxococcota bacterium]